MLPIDGQVRSVAKSFFCTLICLDNIFALQSYCNQTFGIDPDAFAEQFGLPADFDSIP
jgi:predicted transcriptional regulator